MELTILLAKVFGIYLLMMGIVMFFRRDHFMLVVNTFPEERALRFFAGVALFVASVFIILTHNDWSTLPAGIVTFMGWAVGIKALLYIMLSDKAMKKWVKHFSGSWYIWGSLVSAVVGIYLLNYGFDLGWF